jgi:hypothetical protein
MVDNCIIMNLDIDRIRQYKGWSVCGGILLICLIFIFCCTAVPIKDWWVFFLFSVFSSFFWTIIVNGIFFLLLPYKIQLTKIGICYEYRIFFLSSPLQIIRYNDKTFCGFLDVPFLGKMARITSLTDLTLSVTLPPKILVSNLSEIESYIENIDNNSDILNCLSELYR